MKHLIPKLVKVKPLSPFGHKAMHIIQVYIFMMIFGYHTHWKFLLLL